MAYKKHFRAPNTDGRFSPLGGGSNNAGIMPEFGYKNYGSTLPDVYTGHPNRIERYTQYESMDSDPEINAALDIIADFCTQITDDTKTAFTVDYKDKPTKTENDIITEQLKAWYNLNEMEKRITKMIRNTLKYGDQVFIRDPETFQLYWIDMAKLTKIVVNESDGKEPEFYFIKDLSPNFMNLTATTNTQNDVYIRGPQTGGPTGSYTLPTQPYTGGTRFANAQNERSIDSKHILHLSLTSGLDPNWPFGISILENIFKVYKQKELLEDAILIYRVQRAPERRVFYIDTGNMPSHLAMQFVERVKNEIHQRRIPTQTGGGQNMMDATYNPISINEDYFFPQCLSLDTKIPLLDGRTLTLSQLIDEFEQGKKNWVYGLSNKTFELELAEVKWAGITRRDAQVVEVLLDNGEKVIVTPDHRFITRDGREVEAKDLKEGDSLMPLNLIEGYSGPKQSSKKYMRYVSNTDGKIKFVHATISNKIAGRDTEVHHVDFNSRNNNPDNLQIMLTEDHRAFHRAIGTYSLAKQWNDPTARQKLLDGISNLYLNASDDFMNKIVDRNRKNAKTGWQTKSETDRAKDIENLRRASSRVAAKRKIRYSIDMLNEMERLFKEGHTSISKLCPALKKDEAFQLAFRKSNSTLKIAKNQTFSIGPTDKTLNEMVRLVGFKTFGKWKNHKIGFEETRQNHKVVSITYLLETIDTGDITIESKSDSHWFALSAGIYVHNSAEGRGSRVETLPGGENLGQIDDLRYFNNKLLRGLRIPSSYLPTGPDDGTMSYTDGKVTTALIQENRFNAYCKGLQTLVSSNLDREFKLFLSWRGYNVDNSLFELKLSDPLNFAAYRSIDLDASRISNFGQLAEVPYLSKRFVLKKYLGLTEIEMKENEQLWKEESGNDASPTASGTDLRNIGIAPGDINADMENLGDLETTGAEGELPGIEGELPGIEPEMGAPAAGVPTGAGGLPGT